MTVAPPPPPVTVRVPGGASYAADLLGEEPPPRPPVPPRLRALGLAALAVLGTGVAYAGSYEPPPPPAAAPPPRVTGVSGVVGLLPTGEELLERLSLDVLLEPAGGRGDSGSPSEADQLVLLDITGRGFDLRLPGATFPLALPPRTRTGERLAYDLEVVVADCAVEPSAPRTLTMQVERGDGVRSPVVLDSDPQVVRALDRLVSRSCGRPRG